MSTIKAVRQERELIDQLVNSFSALMKAAEDVRYTALLEKDEYDVFAPNQGSSLNDRTSEAARLAILNRITKVFKPLPNEPILISGMLCASEKLCKIIEDFNTSKRLFLHSAGKVQRNASIYYRENSAKYITELLRNEIDYFIDKGLLDLNTIEHLAYNSLDFNACRATTRILPRNLISFSWTWATKNRVIQKITRAKALELASKLKGDDYIRACAAIQACPDNIFAKTKPIQEQLRANILYHKDGKLESKSVTVSGVVVTQQRNLPLPHLVWRDPPSQREVKEIRKRRPIKIEPSPFITELNLYRYLSPERFIHVSHKSDDDQSCQIEGKKLLEETPEEFIKLFQSMQTPEHRKATEDFMKATAEDINSTYVGDCAESNLDSK